MERSHFKPKFYSKIKSLANQFDSGSGLQHMPGQPLPAPANPPHNSSQFGCPSPRFQANGPHK